MQSSTDSLAEPRQLPKQQFECQGLVVKNFAFLHDSIHIVSGSLDGTICKWNLQTGRQVGEPWEREGEAMLLRTLALSPDGQTIACGMDDGSVVRWTTEGKVIEDVWKLEGHEDTVTVESLSWYPGTGEYLASGFTDGTIIIRNTNSGEIDVGPIKTNQEGVLTLAYSPSGARLASGGEYICVWDTKTHELIADPIHVTLGHVTCVVWSLDSSKLYTTSDSDFSARVFDMSGTELHHFEHDYPLHSVALSPKHNVLVCIGECIAQLWDTQSCEPLGQPFGHEDISDCLECVSFSPDGSSVVCGGWGIAIAILTLWRVEDIAPELASFFRSDRDLATSLAEFKDEDSYRIDSNFFRGMHEHIDQRPQQRQRRLKRLRLALERIPARPPALASSRSVQPQLSPRRSLFARPAGPHPITTFASRLRQWAYVRPDHGDAPNGSFLARRAGPSDSEITPARQIDWQVAQNGTTDAQFAQPSSAAVVMGSVDIQLPNLSAEDEYNYGFFANILQYILCRSPRVVPAVRHVAL